MKISFDDLHKAFESRIRLGIMSALAVNDSIDFTTIRDLLDVTEKEDFIAVEKSFVDKKPHTRYAITKSGRIAFENHLKALEKIINSNK